MMRRATLVVVTLAAATACGTTVPTSQQRASSNIGLDGSAGQAASQGGGPIPGASGVGGLPAAVGSAGAPRAVDPSAPTQARGQQGQSAPAAPSGSPSGSLGGSTRVVSGPINIGIAYVDPAAAAAATGIGAKGASVGDPRGYAQALINDVNARGGVKGRKLVPSFYADDVTGASQSEQMATACEQFMTDHKAFGVIGLGFEELASCVEKRGGVNVDGTFGVSSLNAAGFAKYPHYVNVTAVNLDRAAAALVPSLVRQGYFSGWNTRTGSAGPTKPTVGVVSYDTPSFRYAIEKVLKPALARAGHPSLVTVYVNHHNSLSDLSAQSGQTSSAVLNMASNNVTHLIDFDDNGTIGLAFMPAAESQGYRPRYGVTSGSEFNYLAASKSVPANQFAGALGIGWTSLLDVPVTDWLSGANAARMRCAQVLKAAGFTPKPGFDQVGAASLCDAFNVLVTGLTAAGQQLSQASFGAAVDALKGSYQAASNPGTFLSSARRDGVASYRNWAFNATCTCMAYTSGPQEL